MQKKIVLCGGPSTGKTTIINELVKKNYECLEEVSRQVTLKAREKGIEQLFLTEPLLFSELLLEARVEQHQLASKIDKELIFFDRGIPEVFAYLNYFDTAYPEKFVELSKKHSYDTIFITPPWEAIYTQDNERYETFEQAQTIHKYIVEAYKQVGYTPIEIPFGTVEERIDFILKNV